MSNPLYKTVVWDSPEEVNTIWELIVSLNLDGRLREKARKQPTVTFTAKTKVGIFHVTYHPFEGALEVINEDRTFRFVYWRFLVRIDGSKKALKRWLLLHKLVS